jgi:hypothetical protein
MGCQAGRLFHEWWQWPQTRERDTVYRPVTGQSPQCLRCQRTLQVYPQEMNMGHISLGVKGLVLPWGHLAYEPGPIWQAQRKER